MKAVLTTAHGGPEVLQLRLDFPAAAALGPMLAGGGIVQWLERRIGMVWKPVSGPLEVLL